MRQSALLVTVIFTSACLDVPAIAPGIVVRCASAAECPSGQACVIDEGVCVADTDPCLVVTDGSATRRADGDACAAGICVDDVCQAPRCGDGIITRNDDPALDERCDEGSLNSDTAPDACRTTCTLARCGDGVIDIEEDCDDNNTDDGDGCRGDCRKVEVCGDGEVDEGEACDDGDDNPRDGCDTDCQKHGWRSELVVRAALADDDTPFTFVRPGHAASDGRGGLYVADTLGHRVVRVDGSGDVISIAGTGEAGFDGDGGPAALARLESRGRRQRRPGNDDRPHRPHGPRRGRRKHAAHDRRRPPAAADGSRDARDDRAAIVPHRHRALGPRCRWRRHRRPRRRPPHRRAPRAERRARHRNVTARRESRSARCGAVGRRRLHLSRRPRRRRRELRRLHV